MQLDPTSAASGIAVSHAPAPQSPAASASGQQATSDLLRKAWRGDLAVAAAGVEPPPQDEESGDPGGGSRGYWQQPESNLSTAHREGSGGELTNGTNSVLRVVSIAPPPLDPDSPGQQLDVRF